MAATLEKETFGKEGNSQESFLLTVIDAITFQDIVHPRYPYRVCVYIKTT